MKFAKLLVLSMLSLMGTNAWAGVPDGVWTMPEPTGLEFTTFTDDGTRYILYNPKAKMFFASGNGWNTMASLRTFGMEIWLQPTTEADVPEGLYELWDNNVNNPERQTNSHNMFTDDGNSTWVDHGDQGNYSWAYEIVDGCVRFQNAALIADKPEFTGMYLGWDGTYVVADNSANDANHRNAYTAILRHIDPAAEGASVDFKAVTLESYEAFVLSDEYEAYAAGTKTYIASIGLKKAIEDAEELKIDATEAIAVYSSKESTTDKMKEAAAALNVIIEAKKELKAAIADYEAKGFKNTDAAKAVLDNPAATKEEINKAHADLDEAFVAWGSNEASVQNPVDMSSKIVNAHFDNADATTGWSGDAFGRGGTVSDGAEHYSKNYDTYQKITGLTPGVYAIGVYGYYRAGNYGGDAENHWLANDEASKYAKLYGKVGDAYYEKPIVSVMSGAQAENQNAGDMAVTYTDPETQEPVTVYVPNTMATADYYFHTLKQYANQLFVAVDEAGELIIGVKKTSQIGGDWSMFDDFSLTYYGAGADAYQMMLDEALKNYGEITIDEGVVYTESYLTAYQESLKGEKVAATQADVDRIFGAIDGAYQDLQKNIALWKEWKETAQNAFEKYVVNDMYQYCESVWELADLVEPSGEYEEILDAHDWTNEEIEASIAYIKELIAKIVEEQKTAIKEGDDVTYMLVNPDFESGVQRGVANPSGLTGDYGTAVGWHADKFSNGNFTPGPDGKDNDPTVNHAFESWHCHDFDFWQEVENAPEGVYVINVQGYVRNETAGTVTEYDPSIIPIKLYMNNSTANFPDVFSEQVPEDKYDENGNLPVIESHSWNGAIANYPNSMGAAGLCFDWGMYKVQTYGLVKKGDNMRIGVKGKMDGDWWCIWDNFQLTYEGYNPEFVEPALDEALAQISLEKPMGKTVYEQASTLNEKAAEAKASQDGRTMFQMLADITDVAAAITESVTLFTRLNAANETFQEAIQYGTNEIEKATAQALHDQIDAGVMNHEFDDAEVYGLLELIAKLTTRVNLPENMADASDANEVECTAAIVNPTYADYNDNGWTGGAGGTDGGNMNAEMFNKTFNYYQTIMGLDAGTYAVSVQGYFRHGTATEDYKDFIENGNKNSYAYLYAVGANDTVSVPMHREASQAVPTDAATADELPIDWVFAAEPVDGVGGMMVPNMMSTAAEAFMGDEQYNYAGNRVIVKVGSDGKLTIGLIKKENYANDWVIWSNWQLFYYGPNSSKSESDNAMGISSLDADAQQAAKVEFFSMNGARLSAPGKGIVIMRQTMSDGTVKVRKLIVK